MSRRRGARPARPAAAAAPRPRGRRPACARPPARVRCRRGGRPRRLPRARRRRGQPTGRALPARAPPQLPSGTTSTRHVPPTTCASADAQQGGVAVLGDHLGQGAAARPRVIRSPATPATCALSSSARVRRLVCLTTSSTSGHRRCSAARSKPGCRGQLRAAGVAGSRRRAGGGRRSRRLAPAAAGRAAVGRRRRSAADGGTSGSAASSPARRHRHGRRAVGGIAAGGSTTGPDGTAGAPRNRRSTPLDALQQGSRIRRGVRQQHPRAQQFQHQPGRGRPAHLDQRGVDDLGVPGQRRPADRLGLVGHPLALLRGRVDQPAGVRVGHRVEQDQVAEPLEQVGGEPAGVVPGLDDPVDRAVRARPRRWPPARRPSRRAGRCR